ncbi:hypothetical protein GCM10027514_39950 [Azotobacter armeniacus]
MREAVVAVRMDRVGLIHTDFEMFFEGCREHIDLQGLTGGKTVVVYGQTELTHNLMDARQASGAPIIYEATAYRASRFRRKYGAISSASIRSAGWACSMAC